jgi:hypothetical protein
MVEQVEILKRELAESQARSAQLEQILVQRGASTLGEFIDGLRAVVNGAHQGDPRSVQGLQELAAMLDAARSAASGVVAARGIVVPKSS